VLPSLSANRLRSASDPVSGFAGSIGAWLFTPVTDSEYVMWGTFTGSWVPRELVDGSAREKRVGEQSEGQQVLFKLNRGIATADCPLDPGQVSLSTGARFSQ
jgi:hypothetical protein